jgi:hypothetical protein
MNHEKSDNGYPEDPYDGLLDSGRDDEPGPTGDPLDLFWHFKNEALIDPNNARHDRYLKESYRHVLDRIDCFHTYELQALHFESTSELLKWIRADDDRMDWAYSNRTYRRLLEESN